MARELFEMHPVFREWMLRLNEIIHEITGAEILKKLYGTKRRRSEDFDHLTYSNLSIALVEYSLYKTLSSEGVYPDYLMGASLGEYLAITIAGGIDFETLCATIYRLSESISRKCPPGGMIAVMHDWRLYNISNFIKNKSEMAGRNYATGFVISGVQHSLSHVENYLKQKDILHQRLPVKYAFHSKFIDSAKIHFLPFLKSQTFNSIHVPYISCFETQLVSSIEDKHFWNVIRGPIEFQSTIHKLEKLNAYTYLDLSPSGSLANFVRYNLDRRSKSEILKILTPFGHEAEALEKVARHCTKKLSIKTYESPIIKNRPKKKEKQMMTWVFPGQGSQHKCMGDGLWDLFPELVRQADKILCYSIRNLCMENTDHNLDLTQYTQPAIYVVNALSYFKKLNETGKKPDYLAGHSLGEYNALMASGCFDFKTGLRLVQKRSALMSEASGGAMAAIIDLCADEISAILRENRLHSIDYANYNSPSQIVISGPAKDIEKAAQIFKNKNATCMILRVSAAFHSRYMEPFCNEFNSFLNGFKFKRLEIPVISNAYARPYQMEQIKTNLTTQLTHSVQWTDSIRYLMTKGEMVFEEVGPGKVLTNLVKRIQQESNPLFHDNENALHNQHEYSHQKRRENEKPLAAIYSKKKDLKTRLIDLDSKHNTIKRRIFRSETIGSESFKRDCGIDWL